MLKRLKFKNLILPLILLSFGVSACSNTFTTSIRKAAEAAAPDTTAPDAPTGLNWVQTSPHNAGGVTATWTVSDSPDLADQKIQFYADATCTSTSGGLIDLGSSVASTQGFTGSDGTTYSYQITSVDAAGNPSTSPCSSAMLIDTTQPMPGFNGPNGTTPTNSTHTFSYTVSFIDTDGGPPVLGTVQSGVSVVTTGTVAACVPTVASCNANSCIVNITGCTGDGTATVHVASTAYSDLAGNPLFAASSGIVDVVDNTLPLIAITSAPAWINGANVGAYPVTVTCSDPGGSGITTNASVTITDGLGHTAFNTGACGSIISVVTSGLSDVINGNITVTAQVHDAALNSNTASVTRGKDIVAPTLTLIPGFSPTWINISNSAFFPIKGTCSDATSTITGNVSVLISDGINSKIVTKTCALFSAVGGFTVDMTTGFAPGALADGLSNVQITAQVSDVATNSTTTGPTGPNPANSLSSDAYTVHFADANPGTLIGTEATVNGKISIGGTNTAGCTSTTTACTASNCTVTITGCLSGSGSANITVLAGAWADAAANPSAASTASSSFNIYNPTRFAYVANLSSNTISMYGVDPTTGILTALSTPTIASTNPYGVSVDPSGRFAYVSNSAGTVSMFSINASTGLLTALSTPTVASGTTTRGLTFDPTGRFAYAANAGAASISQYTFDTTTGLATPMGSPSVGTGNGPASVTVDPTGRFAYSANYNASTISAFQIDPASGALSFTASVAAGGGSPQTISIHPSGRYAYSADSASAKVSMYTIAADGSLSAATTYNSGVIPSVVAVHPTGRFLYVTDTSDNTVSMYSIAPSTGALTPLSTPTIPTGTSPWSFTFDPSGRFAYVTNSGSDKTVSMYSIDLNTGILSAMSTPTIAAGTSAAMMATTAGPARYAYTANNNGNSVSMYSLDHNSGVMTALSPASIATGFGTNPTGLTVDPTGRFVYVADAANNKISMFSIDAGTGLLTALSTPTVGAGSSPYTVAVDPTGRFAYSINSGTTTVSLYTIAQNTGILSAVATYAYPGFGNSIAIDRSGSFLYTTSGGGSVSISTINQSTGALSAATSTALGVANGVTVDPTGRYVYVTQGSANQVSMFSLNASSGLLTALTTATVTTGASTTPMSIALDPTNRFAYTGNSNSAANNVTMLTNTLSSGILAGPTISSIGTFQMSFCTTVDPTGRFVYTSNGNANTVSMFSITAGTGALSTNTNITTGAGSGPNAVVVTK